MDQGLLLCAVACGQGNGELLSPRDRPLEPPHPAFRFLGRARYEWAGGDAATSLLGWVGGLRARGVQRLWLVTGEAAGETGWAVAGERGGTAAERWDAETDGAVHVLAGHPDARLALPGGSLERAEGTLADAVAEAHDVALADPALAATLSRALAILGSDGAGHEVSDVAWPYFVLPEHVYGWRAQRLLATAAAAWVFDGMGGWDEGALDEAAQRAAARRLREALPAAVAAAVNSCEAPSRLGEQAPIG